jgi:hypothetical protein
MVGTDFLVEEVVTLGDDVEVSASVEEWISSEEGCWLEPSDLVMVEKVVGSTEEVNVGTGRLQESPSLSRLVTDCQVQFGTGTAHVVESVILLSLSF